MLLINKPNIKLTLYRNRDHALARSSPVYFHPYSKLEFYMSHSTSQHDLQLNQLGCNRLNLKGLNLTCKNEISYLCLFVKYLYQLVKLQNQYSNHWCLLDTGTQTLSRSTDLKNLKSDQVDWENILKYLIFTLLLRAICCVWGVPRV